MVVWGRELLWILTLYNLVPSLAACLGFSDFLYNQVNKNVTSPSSFSIYVSDQCEARSPSITLR